MSQKNVPTDFLDEAANERELKISVYSRQLAVKKSDAAYSQWLSDRPSVRGGEVFHDQR